VIYNTMDKLNLTYPVVSEQQKQALLAAKEELENESGDPDDKAVRKARAKTAASRKKK